MTDKGPDRTGAVARVFDQLSAVYDTPAVQQVVYRPAQSEIVGELRRLRPPRIADVGCGTGILASRLAAELRPEVVFGFDASAGMLEKARRRSQAVEWAMSRSEQLPLHDASVDAVVSSHAFHFFDHPAALAEFRRVLRPGGVLMVVVVNPRTRWGSELTSAPLGAASFPDQASMTQLMEDAAFQVLAQRRVRRGPLTLLSPDVLTVARPS